MDGRVGSGATVEAHAHLIEDKLRGEIALVAVQLVERFIQAVVAVLAFDNGQRQAVDEQ